MRIALFRGSRAIGLCLLLAGCLLLASCPGSRPRQAAEPLPPLPDGPRWNVFILLLDALRPDHLGFNGYHRDTSPFLDQLAREGVVFEEALALYTWTMPSIASLFTSQPPRRLLTEKGLCDLAAPPAVLADYLQQQQYRTGAFLTNRTLTRELHFHRGFDTFIENDAYQMRQKAFLMHGQLFPWLRAKAVGQPLFAYVHYMETHSPYWAPDEYVHRFLPEGYPLPPLPDRGRVTPYQDQVLVEGKPLELPQEKRQEIIALYDAGIRQADDAIREVFQVLEELGLRDHSIIWILADHGEELFEHGLVKHGYTLYDEVLRVPMILLYPGCPKGARIPGQVDLTDVFPTTLELLGAEPARFPLDGRSLVPLIEGRGQGKPFVISECMVDQKARRWMIALRTPKDKWINDRLGGPNEYFDLKQDPAERAPRNTLPVERREEYPARIEQWLATYSPEGLVGYIPEQFSPEMIQILKDLGYL